MRSAHCKSRMHDHAATTRQVTGQCIGRLLTCPHVTQPLHCAPSPTLTLSAAAWLYPPSHMLTRKSPCSPCSPFALHPISQIHAPFSLHAHQHAPRIMQPLQLPPTRKLPMSRSLCICLLPPHHAAFAFASYPQPPHCHAAFEFAATRKLPMSCSHCISHRPAVLRAVSHCAR